MFATTRHSPGPTWHVPVGGDVLGSSLTAEQSLAVSASELYRLAREAALVQLAVPERPVFVFTMSSLYTLRQNLQDLADFAINQNERDWVSTSS